MLAIAMAVLCALQLIPNPGAPIYPRLFRSSLLSDRVEWFEQRLRLVQRSDVFHPCLTGSPNGRPALLHTRRLRSLLLLLWRFLLLHPGCRRPPLHLEQLA